MTTAHSTSTALDGHTIVVTAAGSFTPSGRALTGPVDSVGKLAKLLDWVREHGILTTSQAHPVPQVWILGPAACALLGWQIQATPVALQRDVVRRETIGLAIQSLLPLIGQGWTIHGGGNRLHVSRVSDGDIELVIATRVAGIDTTTATIGLDLDQPTAAPQLIERMTQWFTTLQILPPGTDADSAARIADRIREARLARKRGLVATEPGIVPDIVDVLTASVQPMWGRLVQADDIDRPIAEELIELDQDAGLLATAGMLDLPVGAPVIHTGDAARTLASANSLPVGLWKVSLPALSSLDLPDRELLPPPHPQMRADAAVQVWVTTPGLEGLLAPAVHGGLGLDVEGLEISAAVSWDQKGRLLDKWSKELRVAHDAATTANTPALAHMIDDAGESYLAALADEQAWQIAGLAHHWQPVWWAAICEFTRLRSRRTMLRIAREFRLHPLTVTGTRLVYAVGEQDISDVPTGARGRHVVRTRIPLTDDGVVALLRPDTPAQVIDSVAALFGRPAESTQVLAPAPAPAADTPQTDIETPARSEKASAPEASVAEVVSAPAPAEAPALAPNPSSAASATRASTVQPRKKSDRPAEFVGPAAVLDVSGAWLPDGSCVPLPEAVHVGDLVAFARTLRLGYRISASFVESGQIWITNALATHFGIDTASVNRKSREQDLRALTSVLPFVTSAVAAGWKFGNQDPDAAATSMSNWTRIWHDNDAEGSKTALWVVLMAGFEDDPDSPDPDMPILAGDPTPLVLARRLSRFADALKFPWKISGPTTGLDIIKESRPNSYGPTEWRDRIWGRAWTRALDEFGNEKLDDAGNAIRMPFELPTGAGIIARDYAWTRTLEPAEAACAYVHAYDRGGSYAGALSGLEMPIGEAVHTGEGEWEFDPRVPAFILTRIPAAPTWMLPNVLSPAGRDFGDTPQWVTTPQFERALELGYDLQILEAWIWPEHARLLKEWANRFSAAARDLDTADPDDQAVRAQIKVARVRGYGMLASKRLAESTDTWPPYRPEVWIMGVAKAAANIMHFLNMMLEETGTAIIGIDKDTILIASDDPDPVTAWPLYQLDLDKAGDNPKHRPSMGRGFGQWKPEASGLMAEQARYFDGGPYKGKRFLTRAADWNPPQPGA